MTSPAPFVKMNGLGNDIIVADMRGRADQVTAQAAVALAGDPATRFDQIMAIYDPRSDGTDAYIAILNSDGSIAQACGNGTRCVVQTLARESGRSHFNFETIAGRLEAEQHADGLISVDMGKPRFGWQEIPLSQPVDDTCAIDLSVGSLSSPSVASMGNPHAIFWVDEDVWSIPLDQYGPQLEHHPMFPERANISIVQLTGPDEMAIRTWERGAGLTGACGSAACAAGVLAARTGRTGRKVTLTVPAGGQLQIEWRADDNVVMTGSAEWEWSGAFDPATGNWTRAPEDLAS